MTEPAPLKPPKSDLWGAVKWICILLVVLVLAAAAWKAWDIATAPARAVTSTVDSATELAKTGAQNTTEAVAKVTGRLDVQVTQQARLDTLSESAFDLLVKVPQTKPGLMDRAARLSYLRGSDNRVCTMGIDFGTGAMAVWAAADNDGYATSKALGGTADRLIRIGIFTDGDAVGLRSVWDADAGHWRIRWKRTTLKKPVADTVAEARVLDVLKAIGTDCVSRSD